MSDTFKNIFVVIPTIRDLDFLEFWKDAFLHCNLIIVEDREKKTVRPPYSSFANVFHYCWNDISQEFGEKEWIFSRQNAGIRCYGFFKAYQMKADVIITIDDDCYPAEKDFVRAHLENLAFRAHSRWVTTYPHPSWMYSRGVPYRIRQNLPVMVSHLMHPILNFCEITIWLDKGLIISDSLKRLLQLTTASYPLSYCGNKKLLI